MSPWVIYWFSQADSIRETLGVVASLGGIIGLTTWCFMAAESVEPPRWTRWVLAVSLLGGTAALAMPSSRTIALMYVLPRVAESDVIQRDVPELYRLAIDALKSELTGGIEKAGR